MITIARFPWGFLQTLVAQRFSPKICAEAMAGYAIEILSDEGRLREIGKKCRASAQKRFCTTKIIPQYEDFYRRVLERSS